MSLLNLRLSIRSIVRNSRSHIISVIGMSLAFMVMLFILIFVYDQATIDKSQENYDSIYRVELGTWALIQGGIPPWIDEQFPEVIHHARLGGTYWESTIEYNNEYHNIENVLFADGKPFSIFNYESVYGNLDKAFDIPNSVVLTWETSRRIFGNKNPVGEQINYNKDFPLIVSAVVEDKRDIHLKFDMLVNFHMLVDIWYGGNDSFKTELNGSQNFMGYFLISTNDIGTLENKINQKLVEINAYDSGALQPGFSLRPISEIYFLNTAVAEHGVVHGNRSTVIAMIFVALFVILISTINYINLSIAGGISRSKEVGLKKVLGSSRVSLILRFFNESVLLTVVSLVVALILILNLYQPFQNILGIDLPSLKILKPGIYLILIGVLLISTCAGGLYPAIYLSSLKPGNLFNAGFRVAGRGVLLRRLLILIQFTIAIFLSIQSILVFKQYVYMKEKPLGMDKDQILLFEFPDYLLDRADVFKESLMKNTDIEGISFTLQPLGNIRNTNTLNSPLTDVPVSFKIQLTDPEHIGVLGLEMVSGRFFERNREADLRYSWVINETGMRALGYDNPEELTNMRWNPYGGNEITIIGVVKDYHFNSLVKPIEPTFLLWREGFNNAHVRFNTENITGLIAHIENVWSEFEPNKPLNYRFLEETFDEQYNTEQRLGRIISFFTIIAVLISCFGVFGISSFMAKQMARDITLRRVMGAETYPLVEHFSREYFWLLILAAFIAIPLGYLYGNSWLSRFPYQTDPSLWIFAIAFVINTLIALSTVSYHAFKTACLNPSEVLRYE